jgi:hypothetical protein
MSEEGERASLSDIFYDRVKQWAETFHASVNQVLGHVMAHEIGHLLLRTQQHSSAGIMRGQWTVADLLSAAHGQLRFTPEQSERIRVEILVRRGGEDKIAVDKRQAISEESNISTMNPGGSNIKPGATGLIPPGAGSDGDSLTPD